MRDCPLLRILGLVMMTLLAVAFATGTAVRAAPSVTEIRLEAFQLAGGVVEELCNVKGPDHAHIASCALCDLIAASHMPDACIPMMALERQVVATVILPQVERAAARARDPAIPPRGPPAALG